MQALQTFAARGFLLAIMRMSSTTCIHRSPHEAIVESDRCYFCYDAPCMNACPTGIDIPLFIRQINAGNPAGAARTILAENILGGMCAASARPKRSARRSCVREVAEGKPVKIGHLQRYATDMLMAAGNHTAYPRSRNGQAHCRCRRWPGGHFGCTSPCHAWPSGDDLRGPAQGRRSQRIWHRRL